MKKLLLIAIVPAVLMGCGDGTEENNLPDEPTIEAITEETNTEWQITPQKSVGIITEGMTLDGLKKQFGDAVVEANIDVSSEITLPGHIIFPGGNNAISILWNEKDTKIGSIIVRGEGGKWTTNHGIMIGQTLAELVERNGASIKLLGYGEGDFAGNIVSYNGGHLENNVEFDIGIYLKYEGPEGEEMPDELLLTQLETEHMITDLKRFKVWEIIFFFPSEDI